MSLIPFLLDLADEIGELNRGIDDNFGFGIYPHELHHRPCRPANGAAGGGGAAVGLDSAAVCWMPRQRHHPYDNIRKKLGKVASQQQPVSALLAEKGAGGEAGEENKIALPTVGKDGFQVSMSVQQFKPKELTVKTVGHSIVVEGKHEEREDDHGLITRHFVRKYQLPKGYDPKEVSSTLSSDGVLTVKAPTPSKAVEGSERIIEIQQTGPAHLSVKDNITTTTATNTTTTTTAATVAAAAAAVAANVTTTNNNAAAAGNNEKKMEETVATATKPPQCENGDKTEEVSN